MYRILIENLRSTVYHSVRTPSEPGSHPIASPDYHASSFEVAARFLFLDLHAAARSTQGISCCNLDLSEVCGAGITISCPCLRHQLPVGAQILDTDDQRSKELETAGTLIFRVRPSSNLSRLRVAYQFSSLPPNDQAQPRRTAHGRRSRPRRLSGVGCSALLGVTCKMALIRNAIHVIRKDQAYPTCLNDATIPAQPTEVVPTRLKSTIPVHMARTIAAKGSKSCLLHANRFGER